MTMSIFSEKRRRIPFHSYNHCRDAYRNVATLPPVLPHLPDELVEHIFSFLPVKYARELGVVAKRFRKTWVLSRNLCFELIFVRDDELSRFITFVDRIIKSHSGPKIDSLRLNFDPFEREGLICEWLKVAIEKGVEELDLDFFTDVPFQLPLELIDVESLKTLKLTFCQVSYPPKLSGLTRLSTIVLRRMYVNSRLIDALFSTCFLLGALDLINCIGIERLKVFALEQKGFRTLKVVSCKDIVEIEIDSPSLRAFQYYGGVCFFKFTDICNLKDVILYATPSRGFAPPLMLRKLVDHLSHIYVLTISATVLEALSPRIVDGTLHELQYCFQNLKELQFYMEGASFCSVYDTVTFVHHCPRLENLFIDISEYRFQGKHFWELHQRLNFQLFRPSLPSLKYVKLTGYKFDSYELKLARFFMAEAVNLEKLVLVTAKGIRHRSFRAEIQAHRLFLRHWQASEIARIEFFECLKDMISPRPQHSIHPKLWH
ncbi:hypothetical protein K2173_024541 [Erythroxylum novogranatense]|uniref:F-box domain-containing protein n=1 Tax=Erythroxylum novogranatense TaxID=1862640 RepID=A0AAV8SUN2_9ROSI|nr:hypothetical protein K2173_024541 [Erythroxylum novogranatense]